MKAPFEGIRIADLDVNLTQPSHEAPGFERLYFSLSEPPAPEWVRVFEEERRFPRFGVWRNAWVLGTHMVVECAPEELEQPHLNHPKEDVANANQKFVEWVARNDGQLVRQGQERAALVERVGRLRAKLRFD